MDMPDTSTDIARLALAGLGPAHRGAYITGQGPRFREIVKSLIQGLVFTCKPLLVMLITTVPGDLHHSTYVASTRRPTAASKEDAIAPSFTMLSRISSLEIMPRGLLALDAACVALLVDMLHARRR